MSSPHAVHQAAAEAARRRRLRSSGVLSKATVVAVRQLEVLEGGVSLIELDLEIRVLVNGVLTRTAITTTEPVSLVLASRARPGSQLDVFVSRTAEDGVMIEWSA